MKLDINIRLLFSVLFLILLASTFYPTNSKAQEPSGTLARADAVACGGNGTAIITDPGENSCEFQPDIQKITFLRVDLCTSKPTAPTTGAALDRTNCSTFFKNDGGAEVSVQQEVGTQIGKASDYSAVPHGSYTYGVITMHPIFKFTSSVTFSDTISDGINASTTCVTTVGSVDIVYGYHNGLNTAQDNVSCETGAVASEVKIGVNTMRTTGDPPNCHHLLNFNGTNGIVAGYLLEADDTLHNDVPAAGANKDIVPNTSDGCTSGSNNEISKVMGVMEFASPLIIGPRTAGIQIAYNNTQGLSIDLWADSEIYKWQPSFFDFTLSTKNKRSRGAWN